MTTLPWLNAEKQCFSLCRIALETGEQGGRMVIYETVQCSTEEEGWDISQELELTAPMARSTKRDE